MSWLKDPGASPAWRWSTRPRHLDVKEGDVPKKNPTPPESRMSPRPPDDVRRAEQGPYCLQCGRGHAIDDRHARV